MGKVIKSGWHNPVKYILPVVILSLSMFCIDAFALELHREDHISIKRIKLSKGNESLWSNWSIGAIIKALLIDGDYLWIGTSDGVIRYNKKSDGQVVYTTKDGLRSQSILSIARDRDGIKWFGTNGGGLTSYDGKRWKSYDSKDGLVDEYVWSIAFEPDGTMWVGTWYGVNKIRKVDEKPWGRYTLEVLANEWVYVTMIDKEGTKWFGTEGGVNSFDGKVWRTWTHKDGLGADKGLIEKELGKPVDLLPSGKRHMGHETRADQYNPDYVVSGVIDHKGDKWFGTWGAGLSRFDGKNWKTYTMSDGLPGNMIHSLKFDQKGNLWIGTNGGVSRFDGKGFKNYKMEDGLFSNTVYSIAIDQDGTKWFGTFGGVSRFMDPKGG